MKERDPKRATAEGESIRALAEGEAAAKKLQADADLYVRMKEAEGELGPWVSSLNAVLEWQGGAFGLCQRFQAAQGQWEGLDGFTRLKTILLPKTFVMESAVVQSQGVQ